MIRLGRGRPVRRDREGGGSVHRTLAVRGSSSVSSRSDDSFRRIRLRLTSRLDRGTLVIGSYPSRPLGGSYLLVAVPLAIAAGLATAFSSAAAVALAGASTLVASGFILSGSSAMLFTAAFVVLSAGLVDVPNQLTVGGATLSALISLSYLALPALVWLVHPLAPRVRVLKPFVVLLVWASTVSIAYGIAMQGFQNLVVMAIFVGLAYVTTGRIAAAPYLASHLWTLVKASAWPALALYWAGLLQGGVGAGGLVSARAFALFALVPLSVALADARYGSRWAGLLSALLILTIAASLSRTALVAAILIAALAWTRPRGARGAIRTAALVGAAALALLAMVLLFAPLRERVTKGDLVSVAGEVSVNTSGRIEIWRVVWTSYLEAPITGQGAGSAEVDLAQVGPPSFDHPHNDYLRVLHDYGLVGLLLLVSGIGALFFECWRDWGRTTDRTEGRFHLAACLVLSAFAITMVTDNTLVYADFVGPMAIVVGCSLGLGVSSRGGNVTRALTATEVGSDR